MEKKYLIEEFLVDGQRYKACPPKVMCEYFRAWRKSLSGDERKALRKYRKTLGLKNNINAKLRSGIVPPDAVIISGALQRTDIAEPLIVYRTLAKQENIRMSKLEEGSLFVCSDFKGTHVGEIITRRNKLGHIMLILLPPQIHAAYINNLTCFFRHEKELLIDRGQCFRLLEKRKMFGKDGYIVRAENTLAQ